MDNETKPLLGDSGRHSLYTDSSLDPPGVVKAKEEKHGVSFEKHITLLGAVGILTGL